MSNLDNIVSCNIDISNPPTTEEAFSGMLLVIPEPTDTGEEELADMAVIEEAKDLLDYGYTMDSEAYKAAFAVFGQSPCPSKVLVAKRIKAEGQLEDITQTLKRASYESGWYGFDITAYKEKKDVDAAAKWTEVNEKLFAFTYSDESTCPITDEDCNTYFRTAGFYNETDPYFGLRVMAKCFGYQPGSETWALKTVSGTTPDKMTPTLMKKLEKKNITYYTTGASKNITNNMGGKVLAGEWIDIIRFRDWQKNDLQQKVFELMTANAKLPWSSGVAGIEGVMIASLKEGQKVGGISPSLFDDNGVETPGFTVTVPKVTDIPAEDRQKRKLKGCRFSARLEGAIQAVEINGNLHY